jgi:hypothetical protein
MRHAATGFAKQSMEIKSSHKSCAKLWDDHQVPKFKNLCIWSLTISREYVTYKFQPQEIIRFHYSNKHVYLHKHL